MGGGCVLQSRGRLGLGHLSAPPSQKVGVHYKLHLNEA